MAILTEPMKLALVQALACFDTPSQAADAVAQDFGIKVDRSQVAKYDPTKPPGKNLSKKLRAIFEATRAAFLKDTAAIPIAQQAYRLRVLQRALQKAENQGNTAMIAQLLEQAAKESGGAFTNRRELTGAHGGPIATRSERDLTDEELEAELARYGIKP
jgi:hypothetical protein